jgi:HEAT repeat protein
VPGALEKLIADADVHVRIEAALAAAKVAPELCKKAIPVAIESFKTSPKAGHYRAIAILTPCPDEAFPALLAVVEDDPRFRWNAVQTLAGLPVLPQVQKQLKDHPKPHVRAAMAQAIGRQYSNGRGAAPALTAALKDPAFEVRFAAAEALVWVDDREGEVAAAGVPVLCEALASDQEHTRLQAGRLLTRIGPGARAALPLLKDLLADKAATTRVEAALTMVAIDPKQSRAAVPALIEGLGGKEYASARRTAAALAAIGPPAKAAVPELVKLFDHKDPMTRLNAAEAAARIDPAQTDRAVGVILAVLKDPKNKADMLRESGAEALRRIGPGAKAAVPALLEMLQDDGPFHAEVAVTAVALDPVAGKPAVEWVRARLAKEDDEDHYDVVNALETVGPNGKSMLPELTALLKSKAPYIRVHAAVAVGSVGPAASEALPALRGLLANEKSPVNRRKIEGAIKKVEGN